MDWNTPVIDEERHFTEITDTESSKLNGEPDVIEKEIDSCSSLFKAAGFCTIEAIMEQNSWTWYSQTCVGNICFQYARTVSGINIWRKENNP